MLAVDLERFTSVYVRPSCSLCSSHKLGYGPVNSYELRADLVHRARRLVEPSMAPSSLGSSRKLVSSLAGRLATAPLDAHRVSLERIWAQAAKDARSRRPYSSRRPSEAEPTGTGPTEAAPALSCP